MAVTTAILLMAWITADKVQTRLHNTLVKDQQQVTEYGEIADQWKAFVSRYADLNQTNRTELDKLKEDLLALKTDLRELKKRTDRMEETQRALEQMETQVSRLQKAWEGYLTRRINPH
jgi:tRNA nucleotidyltransferase/poly(A) polymerase